VKLRSWGVGVLPLLWDTVRECVQLLPSYVLAHEAVYTMGLMDDLTATFTRVVNVNKVERMHSSYSMIKFDPRRLLL
jgi:hypothetical protein